MNGNRLLALAAVALAVATGLAHAQNSRRAALQTADNGKSLVTIFDNFAHKYPKALYLDLSGATVHGGTGVFQAWWATPFTPTSDHTVTRVEVAVNLVSGTNGLVLSLNSDSNGLPGKALKSWNLKHLPLVGECCVIKAGNDAQGIPIKAGQQYWVVVSANSKDNTTTANWLDNAEDQVDSSNIAIYNAQNGWQPTTMTPQLAFAIRGTD